MLKVQEYLLSGKSLDDLNTELGIKAAVHSTDPLIILNYDQIESPKTHPIVRECRGLVLNSTDWSIAARSFPRFFNWGEVVEEMELFDFSNFMTQTKEDGSLVPIYYFNGWRANTRGSFAYDEIQGCGLTWQQGFCQALGVSQISDLKFDPSVSYITEFCSPYNKVVRRYTEPMMFLLAAFQGEKELSWDEVDQLAKSTPLKRPQRFEFNNIEHIQAYLQVQSETDPTYEGVVICDVNGLRYKIKSATYLGLHRLKGDGENLFLPKNLLPFILTGEEDELLTYFSEVKPALEYYKEQFHALKNEAMILWEDAKHEPDQKSFAMKVKDHKLSGILFQARKLGEEPEKVLRDNPNIILNNLTKYSASA